MLFIKRAMLINDTKRALNISFKQCIEIYSNIRDEEIDKLRNRFTIDEYINRLMPIIDKKFTEEELKELIKFYSSDLGVKVLDPTFLNEIRIVGDRFHSALVQEFSKRNIIEQNISGKN